LNAGLENRGDVIESNAEDRYKINVDVGLGESSEEGKINNLEPGTPNIAETELETKEPAPNPPKMMLRYGPGGRVEPYNGMFGPPKGRRRAKTYP
jgi:hypothetical protein